MAWPGGFKDATELEAACATLEAAVLEEARGAAAALPPADATAFEGQLRQLLDDHRRQWADDASKLAVAVARKPAVGLMLGQIRNAVPIPR